MAQRIQSGLRRGSAVVLLALLATILPAISSPAQEKKADKLAEPITQGQRIFTCGHSFHVFVPGILSDLAKKGDVKDHVQVHPLAVRGSSSTGTLPRTRTRRRRR